MPPQGSRRRLKEGEGDGVDRITDLPEELLLLILGGLGSVRESARTSVLSRRWRGLWTGLPKLVFHDEDPGLVEAVLAQITCPVLNCLDISFQTAVTAQRVSTLLHGAARRSPETFSIRVEFQEVGWYPIRLPCFDRTASLRTFMLHDPIGPPQPGEFTMLTSLSMGGCCMDPAALLPMCPRLRVLELNDCWDLHTVKVHSRSLEELSVCTNSTNRETHHIDIDAGVLKDVKVVMWTDDLLSVSFSAPMVKNLDWKCYSASNVRFGMLWHLKTIRERKLNGFYVVSLRIDCYVSLLCLVS